MLPPPDDPIIEINSTCRDLTVIYYPCVNGNVINKASKPYYIYKDKHEDTKGVNQKRNSEKDRQYNGKMKRINKTTNGQYNIIQKPNDLSTSTPLKDGAENKR
jgi:hypothetical protein